MSRRRWNRPDREITAEQHYTDRRRILRGMAAAGLLPAFGLAPQDPVKKQERPTSRPSSPKITGGAALFRAPADTYPAERNESYQVPERPLTPEAAATGYNNFYEFSTNKAAVKAAVRRFETTPWKVEVAGLVERPGQVDLEDFFDKLPSEERVYRFRCVEAWAMTVPWTGFPMRKFLEWVEPKPEARFVRLITFMRPDQAPYQQRGASSYQFPYYEALSIEEAGNELTLLAHGLYGKELPRQNGAPLRLVVPWKYGLKNIKSIVRIEFTKKRPPTFWNDELPSEYSWHSNVEPEVPHPRWSQARERLIPDGQRVKTMPYNGYADLVAKMYE